MSYRLLLGDYSYSSWSLRGWLMFARFGISCSTEIIDFAKADVAMQLRAIKPAKTVPALITSDESVVWDSLAIAEELADRHPEAGHWPTDPALRAMARSLAAEMHSGFSAIRETCPMNLRAAYRGVPVDAALQADLLRLDTVWNFALERSGGPWLCGAYSAADAFFAPVAARIAGYGLPVSESSASYVDRHLADPVFRQWRAMGLARGETLPWYERPYDQINWPGPAVLPAAPTTDSNAENKTCPYSGQPATHFLELQGRIFGFCNAFCRDKTVADPEAWPAFMALLQPPENA